MLAFLLQFTLVPVALGRLITYRVKNPNHKKPTEIYLIGFLGSMSIFFVLCAGFTWWQNVNTVHEVVVGAFTYLKWTYSVLLAVLCVVWLVLDYKRILPFFATVKGSFCNFLNELKKDKYAIIYAAVFIVLLLVQIFFAFKFQINEWSYDDYDYVVNSHDTITHDMIADVNIISGTYPVTEPKRVATSWPTYIAYLSDISDFEVTTVCHTILPVVLLLMAYGVFYYMATDLFEKIDNRFIFMILLSVLMIFGGYSHYSISFRILCAIWQGKAVVCGIVLPFVFVYFSKLLKDEIENANMISLLAVTLGAASMTTMAALLLPLTLIAIFLVMGVYHRKIVGVRYLLAGLCGPGIQVVYYMLISMLLKEQQTWGKLWFG